MRTIHVDDVRVAEDRQRRLFDAGLLADTADSIINKGLFHAIVLRDDAQTLVAGERRLRIVKDMGYLGLPLRYDGEVLPEFHIPYVCLGDLDELEAEEAELDENIRRVDLSWQERAAVTARLMDIRKRMSVRDGSPAPTTATIASEVRGSAEGVHHEDTRREIILSRHLHDPEVKAAKTVNDAWKVVKRKEEKQRNADLARSVGATFTAKQHRAVCDNSLVWMLDQSAEQFDVILTDPPYGMGADEFGDSGGLAAGEHFYKDDYKTWANLLSVFCPESFRLAKAQAHAYVFCDIDRFHELRSLMTTAGWNCFRTPLIWFKPQASRAPWPDKGPQRKYECILYAEKGGKTCLKLRGDVLEFDSDKNLGHPAQKPVALFTELLSRSVRAGDAVLDPFMGTGALFPAAHAFQCTATGIEADEAAYGIAIQRIEQLI